MFNFERFKPHMSLKKYFFFFTLSLQCLFSFAQISESKTFNLSWNDNSSVRINEETSLILPLVAGNFFDENNIPLSTHIFNVENNTIVQEYIIRTI